MKAYLRHIVLLLAVLVSACTQPVDNVIRFGLASAPVNLDPRYATDATSARINRLLYQRLVDFDERMRPLPSLATWEQLSGQHYRFYLDPERPDFHDGNRLTATDVAATYRSVLSADVVSVHAGTLDLISDIRVVDENTVDFIIDRADPLFPGYLVIGILPARQIESGHPFHTEPVGSGPFRFTAWPEKGRLQLQRLDDRQPVEFISVGDPTVRVLKLLRGEIDILQNDLPAELLEYMRGKAGIKIAHATGSNFAYIGFNLQDPVTGNPLIRQAIAHAIDRQAIIRHLLGDAARPAAALLPPEHWAGNPELEQLEYAPARARAMLAAAGFDASQPLELHYKTSTDPVRLRIATVIQQQLAEVGIHMKLSSYDWGTFFGDIKAGRFQMYSLMWVGIKTPDIFRYAFHSQSLPPGGANRGRFQESVVDSLIEAAAKAATLDEQAVHYRAVQKRLLQDLPYIPLWYEDHVVVSRNNVHGYRLAPDGNFDGLRDTSKIPVE